MGATFFVTFRLADSLPQCIVRKLKKEMEVEIERLKKKLPDHNLPLLRDIRKRHFGKYDHQLDKHSYGACFLRQNPAAEILQAKLHEYDGNFYELFAYSIMPNHAHILFNSAIQLDDNQDRLTNEALENYVQLDKVMQRIKGGSAHSINRLLNRTGKFWAKDSYDHYVRNEKELINIAVYTLQNPVKAGLSENWESWPFHYCKPQLRDHLLFRS